MSFLQLSNIKYGIRFNSLDLMDDIFLTCCAIHNQRKIIAGADLPWSCTQIIMDNDESDLSQSPAAIWRRLREQRMLDALLESNESGGVGAGEHNLHNEDNSAEHVLSYNVVKQRLITHFDVANKKGEVYWPTRHGIVRNYNVASDH
jgi:hypothetical protein